MGFHNEQPAPTLTLLGSILPCCKSSGLLYWRSFTLFRGDDWGGKWSPQINCHVNKEILLCDMPEAVTVAAKQCFFVWFKQWLNGNKVLKAHYVTLHNYYFQAGFSLSMPNSERTIHSLCKNSTHVWMSKTCTQSIGTQSILLWFLPNLIRLCSNDTQSRDNENLKRHLEAFATVVLYRPPRDRW